MRRSAFKKFPWISFYTAQSEAGTSSCYSVGVVGVVSASLSERRRGRNNGQQWIAMAAEFGALRTSEGQTQTHMKSMCVSYAPNPTLATLHSHKMSVLLFFRKAAVGAGRPTASFVLHLSTRSNPWQRENEDHCLQRSARAVWFNGTVPYHHTIPFHRRRDSFLPANIPTTVSNLTQPNNNHYDNHIHNAA